MSVFFSMFSYALADTPLTPKSILINVESGSQEMRVLSHNDTLYVHAGDLASIQNDVLFRSANGRAVFCTNTGTILYNIPVSMAVTVENDYYVPFQEASCAIGLRFHISDDRIYATPFRSPQEFKALLADIFFDPRFRVGELMLSENMTLLVTSARFYSILSSFSLKSVVDSISGKREKDQYDAAIATLLSTDGGMYHVIEEASELNKYAKSAGEWTSMIGKVLDYKGEFIEFLRENGANELLLQLIAYQETRPYEYEAYHFFDEYADFEKNTNFSKIINIFALTSAAVEAEEAFLRALSLVSSESDHKYIQSTVNRIYNQKYGNPREGTAVGTFKELYLLYPVDFLFQHCLDNLGKKLNWSDDPVSLKAKVLQLVGVAAIDYAFDGTNRSNAIEGIVTYSSLQYAMSDYYYSHRDDDKSDTLTDLRAVALMYLKAAMATYENLSFDTSMTDTIQLAINTIGDSMTSIMDFKTEEYAPSFSNVEADEWILNHITVDKLSPNHGLSNITGENIIIDVYADKLNAVDSGVLADVDILEPISFDNQYVSSLRIGDTIDLTSYCRDNIIIEQLRITYYSSTTQEYVSLYVDDFQLDDVLKKLLDDSTIIAISISITKEGFPYLCHNALFDRPNTWSLHTYNDQYCYYSVGTEKILFNAASVIYDQVSSIQYGYDLKRIDDIRAFFDYYHAKEWRVKVSVVDGVITEATILWHP